LLAAASRQRGLYHTGAAASSDTRFQAVFPFRESTSGIWCLCRESHVPGNSPHKGHQFARNRHDDLIGVLAARQELSIPCAQADLPLRTEVLDGFGQLFQPQVEMATALRRIAVRPRPFNQGPAGMAMPGLGDAPLGAPWATGIVRGRQAQIPHQLCGVGNAREVSQFGDGRDGHGELYPPQRLEGLDHWGEAPGFDPLMEFLFQTLAACGVLGDRPHVLVADDLRRWSRTDDFRAPSEMRGAPMGLARLANVLAQEKGFEALLRGFEVTETIFTGATQIAHGFVIDLGDVDGGEVARTPQPGQLAGIAAVGLDPVPGLFRNQCGGDHPTVMPRLGQIAIQPIAARPGFVDKDEGLGLRVQWSNPVVEVTLAGAASPQGDDLRAVVLGHIGDRDGLLMDISADIKHARLGHG
jgi:hypothetical protein